ncbi:MAG: response regulator transcription factor [Chloroflexi bacterium]|nr:response regulator transcription factor [Chloroflexota bacterium]
MNKTRVFIVDDHPLMRSALQAAIDAVPDMEVVGQAVDGEEALSLIPAAQPDLVIMDLMMPKMNGWSAIAALKESPDQVPILALSSTTEEEKIFEAIQGGALGYVAKDVQRDELIRAIRLVAKGEAYLPPKIASKLLDTIRQPKTLTEVGTKPIEPLTNRQQEVLDLLGQALSNHQIAENLHISTATLRVHIHHMIKKLGFENRHELVVYAVRCKLDGGDKATHSS